MSDKPFTPIAEQIALLERRGMSTDADTASILLREGYYQVVNGYKSPFLDTAASRAAKDDRYRRGVSFNDLYSLFRFDRDLRETTFHYLLRVEALVRTVCSYTFAEAHRGTEDYLDPQSFATKAEYESYGLKRYVDDLHTLQQILYRKAKRGGRDFIDHYRRNHGGVPIWVLVNDLTFGNMEHFFNLMKPEEQRLVCKRIVKATGKNGGGSGFFGVREARIGLNLMVKARNMCAHDERLYCARIGKRQNASYVEVLGYARRYLPEAEHKSLVGSVAGMISRYTGESEMVGHVLRQMGFSGIA